MKIYISGPMTGVKDYVRRFQEAEEYLRDMYGSVDIINPAHIVSELPRDTPWNRSMHITLNALDGCDAIFMLNGWENSKGAQIEKLFAEGSNMQILYEARSPIQKPPA